MMHILDNQQKELIRLALAEDIGSGDLSAQLIPADTWVAAQILTRSPAILCGAPYAREVFHQVDATIKLNWLAKEGDALLPNQVFCTIKGPARSVLTAERTALNFLQTLSATATRTAYFVELINDTGAVLLDTRKTLPNLRMAQKYAVKTGGGENHRLGLFDAVLIKENHIAACGSLTQAIAACQRHFSTKMIVEVENLTQLAEAIAAGAVHIMLDNFSLALLKEAVLMKPAGVKLEASGGINEENIRDIANTGVDYLSLGTLTKDIQAIDLSLRVFEIY
ncbi:MAG TPA: carboxylating nicotinate-nucleotide diphosphorylase [Gammaproteobacteria bacterium]|nr:carboxylating nicotinate-nucleotide diphosphorylase [Gammaproteobacteria bacterium]